MPWAPASCAGVLILRVCGNRTCTFTASVFSYPRIVHFFGKRIFGVHLWKQKSHFCCKCEGFVAFLRTMATVGHLKRICKDAFSVARSTKDMLMRDVRRSGR